MDISLKNIILDKYYYIKSFFNKNGKGFDKIKEPSNYMYKSMISYSENWGKEREVSLEIQKQVVKEFYKFYKEIYEFNLSQKEEIRKNPNMSEFNKLKNISFSKDIIEFLLKEYDYEFLSKISHCFPKTLMNELVLRDSYFLKYFHKPTDETALIVLENCKHSGVWNWIEDIDKVFSKEVLFKIVKENNSIITKLNRLNPELQLEAMDYINETFYLSWCKDNLNEKTILRFLKEQPKDLILNYGETVLKYYTPNVEREVLYQTEKLIKEEPKLVFNINKRFLNEECIAIKVLEKFKKVC